MENQEKYGSDGKSRQEHLIKQWGKEEASSENLTLLDLHLLLVTSSSPVQALVRQIATSVLHSVLAEKSNAENTAATSTPPVMETLPDAAQQIQTLQTTCQQREQELEQARAQLLDRERELKQLAEKAQQITNDLQACNALVAKLGQEKDSAKAEGKKLQTDKQQLRQALQEAQQALADTLDRTRPPPALALLRQDPLLAQEMGLDNLPADDTQALIQTVAVLAQFDNLKRLWAVLKDRCEAEKRPATDNERTLLQAAMAWHNHNWRSLPFRLIEPAPGSAYDYTPHMRCRHVTKGETVAALYLPGIADGSGQPECKALVQTQ